MQTLAREFTQDTFVRAFAQLPRFRGDAAFSTWIHRITVTVVANAMRRVKRLKTRETELDDAIPIHGDGNRSDPILRDRLQKAIDGLGEIYRTTLIMHDLEGYTHQEIAEILGVAEGTCKSRLAVARAQLRGAAQRPERRGAIMSEDQLDNIINTAADHYNVPPVNPPFDQMWTAIESEAFAPKVQSIVPARRASLANNPWLRMAAVLVLGVVIGRYTMRTTSASAPVATPTVAQAPDLEASYQLSADRYLGQTVTLVAGLPKQLQSGRIDSAYVARASESLTQLRLLMDSPAASNPRLRALFEDLELVLVQVVQMPSSGNATDAKLIRQAMQEKDVMPRLVDAVADTPNF